MKLSKLIANLDKKRINLDSVKLPNNRADACMGFWAGDIINMQIDNPTTLLSGSLLANPL